MYSCYHDTLPDVFNNYFVTNKIHSHITRSASKIHINSKRTNNGKFPFNMEEQLNDLKNLTTYYAFKKSSKL